jgi:hypothetical protein
MLVMQYGHSRTVGSSAEGFRVARFTALMMKNSTRATSTTWAASPQIRSSGGVWFPHRRPGRRRVCGAPTTR